MSESRRAKKGEVPEAFKKQWKNKDKDGDGKENEPMPEGLKKHMEKKSHTEVQDSLIPRGIVATLRVDGSIKLYNTPTPQEAEALVASLKEEGGHIEIVGGPNREGRTANELYDHFEERWASVVPEEHRTGWKTAAKLSKWEVEVSRTGYASTVITVEARSERDAERMALRKAGDIEFSEKDADYEVEGVVQVRAASDRTAGCEKLPEGPMRDNCEKKKKDKDDKKDDGDDKKPDFLKKKAREMMAAPVDQDALGKAIQELSGLDFPSYKEGDRDAYNKAKKDYWESVAKTAKKIEGLARGKFSSVKNTAKRLQKIAEENKKPVDDAVWAVQQIAPKRKKSGPPQTVVKQSGYMQEMFDKYKKASERTAVEEVDLDDMPSQVFDAIRSAGLLTSLKRAYIASSGNIMVEFKGTPVLVQKDLTKLQRSGLQAMMGTNISISFEVR